MAKKIITARQETFSPYDFEGTLINLKSHVEDLITKYGCEARLDWEPRFYEPYDQEPSPKFHIDIQRSETDEEYERRTGDEKRYKAEQEARERAELERLQQKFGVK